MKNYVLAILASMALAAGPVLANEAGSVKGVVYENMSKLLAA